MGTYSSIECHNCGKHKSYNMDEDEYLFRNEKEKKLLKENGINSNYIGYDFCIDCLDKIDVKKEVLDYQMTSPETKEDFTCPNCNTFITPVAIPYPWDEERPDQGDIYPVKWCPNCNYCFTKNCHEYNKQVELENKFKNKLRIIFIIVVLVMLFILFNIK